MNRNIYKPVKRLFQWVTLLLAALLILPSTAGVINIQVGFEYVAAEGVEDVVLDTEFDFVRLLDSAPTKAFGFANNTAVATTFEDVLNGPTQDAGYLRMNASASTNESVNFVMTGNSNVDGMAEIMYMADTISSGDEFRLNFTLNATYAEYDYDNFAVGNDAGVATIWYKDEATDQANTTLTMTDQTFYADIWYVFTIYWNANYTVDVEWRWKSNFTLCDSKHITDANLDSFANITLMNLSNVNANAGVNAYSIEYLYYANSDTSFDYGQTATTTSWSPTPPPDQEHMLKLRKASLDADVGADQRNMSGGDNLSAALGTEFFGTVPASLTATLYDNNSAYDTKDIKYVSAMTPEENETYKHEQAWAWGWGDNIETTVLDDLRLQIYDDKDDGYIVDYRITSVWISLDFSDALQDAVQEDFWEGIEDTDADIEAMWPFDKADGTAISGDQDDIKKAVKDALSNTRENSFGLLCGVFDEAGDIVDSGTGSRDASAFGFGDGSSGISSAPFTMVNAAIGSLVDGVSTLLFDAQSFLTNSDGQLNGNPFSLVAGGTVGKMMIFVIIFVVFILLVIFEMKTGIFKEWFNKLSGKKSGSRTI